MQAKTWGKDRVSEDAKLQSNTKGYVLANCCNYFLPTAITLAAPNLRAAHRRMHTG